MKIFLAVGSLIVASFFTPASAQTNTPANPPATPPAANTPATPAPAPAVNPTPSTAPTPPVAATPPPKPVIFRPPGGVSGGEIPYRVGGGSRIEGSNEIVYLDTLVPEKQVALTTQEQPTLYWYQSNDAKFPCEVTVTEPKNPKPLLQLMAPAPLPAGIHAVRLSAYDEVKLKPNVTYRWSIAVVIHPDDRSQDIIADGLIKRIDPSAELAARLAKAGDADKASIYAQNGIWCDALQTISDQIEANPKDAALRAVRADLLKQVGLDGAKMENILVTQR